LISTLRWLGYKTAILSGGFTFMVRQSARQAISTLGLDGILYLLGVHDREAL
jgi:phosphoserine phosphatase